MEVQALKRKVVAANRHWRKIVYGNWACYALPSGKAFWKWEPKP
jgi:hypothetical protein